NNYATAATGFSHTCAITSSAFRKLFCWGANKDGQLGLAAPDVLYGPSQTIPIPGDYGVQEVSVGRLHTCARTSTNRLLCTGNNDEGQLGTGDRMPRRAMTEIVIP